MISSTTTYAWSKLDAGLKQRLKEDGRELCSSMAADGGPGAVERLLRELVARYDGKDRGVAAWHFVSEVLAIHRREKDGALTYARLAAGLCQLDASLGGAILSAVCQDALSAYREALLDDPRTPFVTFIPELPAGAWFRDLRGPLVSELLEAYRAANTKRTYGGQLGECWRWIPPAAREDRGIMDAFCATFELPTLDSLIDGKYRLEALVGIGGMGIVYRAFHEHLLKPVALKTMRPDCKNVALFIQEGRTTVEIDDERFVTVGDAGLSADVPPLYYTMNLVEDGRSLTDLLEKPALFGVQQLEGLAAALELPVASHLNELERSTSIKNVTAEKAGWVVKRQRSAARQRACAAIVKRAALALHELHKAEYIHCDLKPANVLICPRRGPMIADLGLSRRLVNGVASKQQFAGTPEYSSPEQLTAQEMTAGSDVYQLGALLYRCVTGGAPPMTLATHGWGTLDFAKMRLALRGIDTNLAAVCRRAMAQEPQERYESALAMGDDLERFIKGKPVQARACYGLRKAAHATGHFWGTWVGIAVVAVLGLTAWAIWSRTSAVPGCLASENRYRLRETVPRPDVNLISGSQWPSPSYKPFILLGSSIYFDLSAWQPLAAGADPRTVGRVEEARYTRVIDLMRKRGVSKLDGQVDFQFRTEGFDIDLRCTTHPFAVRGSRDTVILGGGTEPVTVREIMVDISNEPLERPIRIVLQGSLWNGFQRKSNHLQWIGFLAPERLSRAELALHLPDSKPLNDLPRLFEFAKGTPELEVPAKTQNFYASENGRDFVWRPTDIGGDTVYKMEWDWDHEPK